MRRGSRPRYARVGAVLLEIIAAVAILALIGTAVVAQIGGAFRVQRVALREETNLSGADALLSAASLWPRADLDRHLGVRPEGPWFMRIQRPTPQLYEVILTDSGGRALLETWLYRPDSEPGQ